MPARRASRPQRGPYAGRLALTALLLTLLTACAHVPPSPPAPVGNWSAQRERLLAQRQFQFSGRLAVAANGEGFSGGIDWQQRDGDSTMRLRGPLGGVALQLNYDGHALQVQRSDGTALAGEQAAAVLREALGFDAPLASLAYWLRGCDDPASAADTTLDEQQRLAALRQQGWELRYDAYERHGALWLPQRITLQREAVRLKLLIQSWTLPG